MASGKDKGDAQLRALAALDGVEMDGEAWSLVRQSLTAKFNMVNARAAKIIGEKGDLSFEEPLQQLFERALINPVKSDPGCLTKLAVVEALDRLESQNTKLFLKAMGHVQLEPVWGSHEDTAGELRGRAFSALVTMGYANALFEGMPLLVDSEPESRQLAVAAYGHTDSREAELILRMKALSRDAEPRVTTECFSALMKLNGDRSLPFVEGYLDDGDPDVAAGAAVALGESRHPQAFKALKRVFQASRLPEVREAILMAMSLIRSEEANHFMVDLLGRGSSGEDEILLRALSIHQTDPELVKKVRDTVAAMNHDPVTALFREYFQ